VTWIGVGSKALAPALNRVNLHCTLRSGDFNNFGAVALQNTLVKCYGQDIAIDGDFGGATERALIMAQTWERHVNGKTWLAIVGVYGYDTFQAIRWLPRER
jgi:hypothetical protein